MPNYKIEDRVEIEVKFGMEDPDPSGPPICSCGSLHVDWYRDPYQAEIHDKYIWQYLCINCYDDLRWEI